jgi:hypothetical protein
MKSIIKSLFVVALILVSFNSCKKISAPNEDAKKIFGEWDNKKTAFIKGGFFISIDEFQLTISS